MLKSNYWTHSGSASIINFGRCNRSYLTNSKYYTASKKASQLDTCCWSFSLGNRFGESWKDTPMITHSTIIGNPFINGRMLSTLGVGR